MLGQPAAEQCHRGNHVLPSLLLLAHSKTSKLGTDICNRLNYHYRFRKESISNNWSFNHVLFFYVSCALLHQTHKSRVILVNKIYYKMVFVSLALQEGSAGGEQDSLC